MKSNLAITLQVVSVIIGMLAGIAVYMHFDPEMFVRYDAEVMGQADLDADPAGYYGGKIAGEGVYRLTKGEELGKKAVNGNDVWKESFSYPYITIETEEIIGTNVYAKVLWLEQSYVFPEHSDRIYIKNFDQYRIEPELILGPVVRAEAYQEYYLVKLADGSYVPARLSSFFQQEAERGTVTLPLGIVYINSEEVIAQLEEICSMYGADPTYTVYMIDEEWGLENHLKFFLLRLGAAMSAYILVGVGLVLAVEKLFGEKAKESRDE